MYLFIDTTNIDQSTIGLLDQAASFQAKLEWTGLQNQSEQLILKIEQILSGHNISKDDLEKIVVVTGPGSYTGQRVGIATANALAFGLGLPIIGITNDELQDGLLPKLIQSNNKTPASASYLNPPHITKPKNHRQ